MWCPHQRPFWNQNYYLIAQSHMHKGVQGFYHVIWSIFLGNIHIKSVVYENSLKIFPTRHWRTISDWCTYRQRCICLHQDLKRRVCIKTAIHHFIQETDCSHGTSWILPSSINNWIMVTQNNIFSLFVDNFGVKYFSKDDADHLLNSLRNHYAVSTDW